MKKYLISIDSDDGVRLKNFFAQKNFQTMKSEFIKFMNSDNLQNFRNRNNFNEIKNINLLNDGVQNTFYIEDHNGTSKSFLTAQHEIVAIFKGFANVIFGSEICSA